VGRTVILSANSAWNIANFRSRLIKDLIAAGYRIVAVAPPDASVARIEALGAEFRPIRINSSGLSPLADLRLLVDYVTLFRQLQPVAFLGFTAKPNIYGSLAAGLLGIRTINNISGLGTAFMRPGPLMTLVSWLYRIGLRNSSTVFFQNPHDRQLFVDKKIVRQERTAIIPGSGVDLQHFAPSGKGGRGGGFRFLFVGRLLRDKGIGEYVEAARLIAAAWPKARFQVLGFLGTDNRTAVPSEEVARWGREGWVEYLGDSNDVRPFLQQADCVVLPSYREGLPRTLLEASAMARPMIATDVPGCRDVIVEGETGLLCAARSPEALAAAMEMMLRTDPAARAEMGRRARLRVERDFDEALVSKAYLEALGA
jgi:glycosyltransferase involved in cell wall biosynthesis